MNSKIYYIDCYQGENKEGNIGFVKLEDEKIFVMLRGIYAGSGMDCKVYAWDRKGQQTQVMTVSVRNGYGQASSRWPGDMDREKCYGIYIPLYGGKCGKSQIRQCACVDMSVAVKSEQPQEKPVEDQKPISTFKEELPAIGKDKWSQLCITYPQIHLFQDVDTVVIKPKDMVVLTQEYQDEQLHRLKEHKCSAAQCVVYVNVLVDMERIFDHLMNIVEECRDHHYHLLVYETAPLQTA